MQDPNYLVPHTTRMVDPTRNFGLRKIFVYRVDSAISQPSPDAGTFPMECRAQRRDSIRRFPNPTSGEALPPEGGSSEKIRTDFLTVQQSLFP